MRTTLQALGAALLLALAAGAAAPPTPATKQPDSAREADQLDYLFLGSDRPVRLRLHVRCGDRPYDAVWSGWMDRLFAWFDHDGDGVLRGKDVSRLPQPGTLQNQAQGAIGGGGGAAVSMSQVDTNKDGVVSKAEFKAYFRNGGLRPLQFSYNNQAAATAKQVNDAIYRRLDKDGDGRLTEAEVARLPQLVAALDENEDEQLTAAELNTATSAGIYGFAVRPARMGGQQAQPDQGLIEVPDAPDAGKRLAADVVRKYDADKNGKLTRREAGLPEAEFARADANNDGALDAAEVAGWLAGEPDLIFRLRAGQVSHVVRALRSIGLSQMGQSLRAGRAELHNPNKRDLPLAARVKQVDPDNLQLTLGDTRLLLQGTQGQVNSFNGVKEFYVQQFNALEDKKGYVARSQEKESQQGQNQFLFQLFAQADRDADDKLTMKELVGWLDLASEGGTAFVSLTVEDAGRGVFEVIDADGSTRLSLREMRSAWQRLKPLAKDGKGLAVADLPRTLRVGVGQGNSNFQQMFFVYGQPQPQKKPAAADAPVWFRKMDRNGDGDISPKEWLGTEEEFREMDTDGDGLVSAAEARRFDARKKQEARNKK
jgi:Ca2+-binding EF-hand superfamily protein